jgi:hypothetical protein
MNEKVCDDTNHLQSYIRSRLRVDPDHLADPDIALTDLALPLDMEESVPT